MIAQAHTSRDFESELRELRAEDAARRARCVRRERPRARGAGVALPRVAGWMDPSPARMRACHDPFGSNTIPAKPAGQKSLVSGELSAQPNQRRDASLAVTASIDG
jgi:hypothetical protein